MRQTTVHVLIPFGLNAACGVKNPYRNGGCRSAITCKNCKKTDLYKDLPPGINKGKKK